MPDPHRPRYHFSPDKWMNDPIPFYWDGTYHVYLQHNPGGAYWGDMHWAHAVSRNLVHWEQAPIALTPTPGGPDQDGVWTGCVCEHDGTFYALYTGIPRLKPLLQVQCLATSHDLTHWKKRFDPIIAEPPPDFGDCFRDPQVWRERDRWRMIIGSELPDLRGGAALLYESTDLHDWTYLGVLSTSPTKRTGRDFECPDFFPLGRSSGTSAPGEPVESHTPRGSAQSDAGTDSPSSVQKPTSVASTHVLLSSRGRTWWQTGDYDPEAGRFTVRHWGPVDSEHYYAAKTLLDGHGRLILFGWIRETRSREAQIEAGWSGVLALPRVLSLLLDGTLGQEPAPELETLRGAHRHFGPLTLTPNPEAGVTSQLSPAGTASLPGTGTETVLPLEGVSGATLEIIARFSPLSSSVTAAGLRVRCTPDQAEYAEVIYDTSTRQLGNVSLTVAPDEPLTLRIFVDGSVVEAFANGRTCYTTRTYPQRPDALGVHLIARGGTVSVESIDVWDLAP